ncbi:hypothetical protein SAMN05192529_13133 [Arachidicoccus rhizosphaerae]|uniref:Uncharacterized protein n=2 Tax=Arachidicoccus rhizosphaerae TaxID=551991 RepID=A0A1H4CFY5_9BACT|nr:hypothetical protein SAMN05192529_13133 [Arachidicoccus rhizosphaerae]
MMSVLRNGVYAPICVARNVNIELDGDINEASKPEGSTMRTYFYGWNSYKITVDGLVSIDPTQFTQSELEDLKLQRQVLSFKCEDSGNPGVIYSGDLLIESISKSTTYNDMQQFTMNCQGSGDLYKSGTVQNTNFVRNVQFTQTGDSTGTITFEPVGDATQWAYRVNGGALQTTTSTTISLTGINSIRNNILITPDNGNGTSYDFVMAGICYSAVTSLTVQQLDGSTLLASWVATSSATMFKWEAGDQSGTVAATSIVIPNLSGAVTVKITPLCSNNVFGVSMSKSFTLVDTCNSAITSTTYTQGVDTADIHFVSSGTAASFEYQVNGGSWVSTTDHDFTLTGLVQLESYTVVIRPKCANGIYGQSASLAFTASGSLLKSQDWDFTFAKNNCTGANSLGTSGTYNVPEGAYNLTQSTIKTIGDDMATIEFPAFITSIDRTGLTFGLTPDNTGTQYAIDDAQTDLNNKTAFLAWAVAKDADVNGQNYVNGSQTCKYVPLTAKCYPIVVSASNSASNQAAVEISAPLTYNDTEIDSLFNGLVTMPTLTLTITFNFTTPSGGTAHLNGSYNIGIASDHKGYGGTYYMAIPDGSTVNSASISQVQFGAINTTWKTPNTNIQCTAVENSI